MNYVVFWVLFVTQQGKDYYKIVNNKLKITFILYIKNNFIETTIITFHYMSTNKHIIC